METWHGIIRSLDDALRVVEAARTGVLPRVTRRLTDDERASLIKSGAVFCFEEHESQVRRWADSRLWSSSRMKGSFLLYQELPPQNDASATASSPTSPTNTAASSPDPSGTDAGDSSSSAGKTLLKKRALSLTTLYGQKLRLISYYTDEDTAPGRLPTVDSDDRLAQLELPEGMYFSCNDTPVALSRKSATMQPLPTGPPVVVTGSPLVVGSGASSSRRGSAATGPAPATNTAAWRRRSSGETSPQGRRRRTSSLAHGHRAHPYSAPHRHHEQQEPRHHHVSSPPAAAHHASYHHDLANLSIEEPPAPMSVSPPPFPPAGAPHAYPHHHYHAPHHHHHLPHHYVYEQPQPAYHPYGTSPPASSSTPAPAPPSPPVAVHSTGPTTAATSTAQPIPFTAIARPRLPSASSTYLATSIDSAIGTSYGTVAATPAGGIVLPFIPKEARGPATAAVDVRFASHLSLEDSRQLRALDQTLRLG
ncbi:Gluconate transport-inducing protein [Blastocladiella emersonii ATCC 22665]|nr:Gluconate transport-inducing protein [Blastocladiella emersonii ATCC 22665]